MSTLVWLRYRVGSSSSHGELQWEFLCDARGMKVRDVREAARDRVARIADNHNWSEHFRGVKWSTSRHPPRLVVESCAARARNSAAASTAIARAMERWLRRNR